MPSFVWIPVLFVPLLFPRVVQGEDRPSLSDWEAGFEIQKAPSPPDVALARAEFINATETEVRLWYERLEELEEMAARSSNVGGRRRHLRDGARSIEHLLSEIETELRELRSESPRFWDPLKTKIELKLHEIRMTYDVVKD